MTPALSSQRHIAIFGHSATTARLWTERLRRSIAGSHFIELRFSQAFDPAALGSIDLILFVEGSSRHPIPRRLVEQSAACNCTRVAILPQRASFERAIELLKLGLDDVIQARPESDSSLLAKLLAHVESAATTPPSPSELNLASALLRQFVLRHGASRAVLLRGSRPPLNPIARLGLSNDEAIALAISPPERILQSIRSGTPDCFDIPSPLPKDEPALWALDEAGFQRVLALPVAPSNESDRPQQFDLALLAIPAEDSGRGDSSEYRSSGNISPRRLQSIVEVLGRVFTEHELPGFTRELTHALIAIANPCAVGVMLYAGRNRWHEVHETRPLPLSRARAFESWFHEIVTDPGDSRGALLPGFDSIELLVSPELDERRSCIALAYSKGNRPQEGSLETTRRLAHHIWRALRLLASERGAREELIQSLLDGLPVGVALLDPYGRIVLANPSGHELLRSAGVVDARGRVQELGGEGFYDLTFNVEQSERSLNREAEVGEKVFALSLAAVPLPSPLDSEDLPSDRFQLATPPPESFIARTGYTVALRDITEAHSLRQQLHQAEKLTTMGTMVSGVAHELNNPLTGIRGFTELILERKDLHESTRADLQRIQLNTERCARIVSDLLSFARRSRLEDARPVDISEILGQVIDLLVAQLKRSQVSIKRDFERDPPRVLADPHQLQQVFINLINNAAQAIEDSPAKTGTVTLRLRRQNGNLEFSVEDTGVGIRPEHLPKIFDPFFTTRGVRGTGLGLSICYGILRDHGGAIRAESPPGGGARFVVELPVLEAASEQTTRLDEGAKARPIPALRTALIVDRSPASRKQIQEKLSELGLDVDVAANEAEALATLRLMRYDLVLWDPGREGFESSTFLQGLEERKDHHARRVVVFQRRPQRDGESGKFKRSNGSRLWTIRNPKPTQWPSLLTEIASHLANNS